MPRAASSSWRHLLLVGAVQRWTWVAMVVSVVVCLLLVWMHYSQEQTLRRAERVLTSVREARIDLAAGFLKLALAGDAQSLFRREEGLALLDQAATVLARVELRIIREGKGEPDMETPTAFRRKVAAFRKNLDAYVRSGPAGKRELELPLRLAYHDLERQAQWVDLASQKDLHALSARLDTRFAITLLLASVLLSTLCIFIHQASRKYEAVDQALRRSEADFRGLFEVVSVGMAQVETATGRFLRVNQKLCGITGYSAAELLETTFVEITHPDSRQRDWDLFQSLVKGEEAEYHADKRYIRKDQGEVWVRAKMNVVRDAAGQPLHAVAAIEDVTERRQAQAALERQVELQDQLAKIVTTVPGMIYSFRQRPDGSVCMPYATSMIEEIYGLKAEDVREDFEPAMRKTHPGDRGHVAATIAESARTMQPWRDTFRVYHPRKGERWLEGHSVPQRETDGSILWRGFVQDVTDRQQAEEEVLRQTSLIRSLLDSIPDLVFLKDLRGVYLSCNPALAKHIGRAAEEIVGKNDHDLFAKEAADTYRNDDQRMLETGRPLRREQWLQRTDGQRVLMDTLKTPYFDSSGRLLGVLGISRDITERHEAQQRQARLHRRNELILEAAAEGILGLDLAGNHTFVNPAAARMLGYGLEELVGGASHATWHHPRADSSPYLESKCLIQITLSQGLPQHDASSVFWRKDGTSFPVEYSTTPILEKGRVVGAVVSFSDISERKAAEEALRQQSEELTRFTYMVSHDLKSPLITIRTFLGFLEKDLKRGEAEGVRNDLEHMRRAAEKMGELLDELLELSRIGRKVNAAEDVPLQALVQEALVLVGGAVAERGVEVRVTKTPLVLCGDRRRLLQIFQNLLDNAVKYMGDQPTPRVEVGVEQRGQETVIFVRDNGLGIDPRHKNKLFGLFEKLHPGTPGTGIGLATVKRIVEVHGGRVWAESAGPGQGATFFFTLNLLKQH